MVLKKLTTTSTDYYRQEYMINYIPTPGEAIIVRYLDTDTTNVKIGDGIHTLYELPCLFSDDRLKGTSLMNKTCAQCEHLCVINRNKIYAVCDETGKVFELWRMDTRESDACDKFTPTENQNTEITLLKCPYCKKPMHWIMGNPVFSYWECYNCNKAFEYNIWTETFHDEKDFI